jgi:hypothetical protein
MDKFDQLAIRLKAEAKEKLANLAADGLPAELIPAIENQLRAAGIQAEAIAWIQRDASRYTSDGATDVGGMVHVFAQQVAAVLAMLVGPAPEEHQEALFAIFMRSVAEAIEAFDGAETLMRVGEVPLDLN